MSTVERKPIEYTAPAGMEVDVACRNLSDLAWRENRPARMEFNGTEVVAQPGDTSTDLADRWWTARNERRKEIAATIIIEVTRDNSYTIRLGDAYHDHLCWDEMLGCLARLTINGEPTPEKAGYGGLKTKEQWDAQRASYKHSTVEN